MSHDHHFSSILASIEPLRASPASKMRSSLSFYLWQNLSYPFLLIKTTDPSSTPLSPQKMHRNSLKKNRAMKHIIIGYHHALRSFPQQSTYFDVALYLLPFAHKISCTFALFFHERISLHPSGASHRYTIMKKLFVYFLHNCSHPGTYTPIFWQSFQSLIVWLLMLDSRNKTNEKKVCRWMSASCSCCCVCVVW